MGKIKLVAQIDKDKCIKCGKCKKCSKINNPKLCSGCGKCLNVCPVNAITLIERNNKTRKAIINKSYKTMRKRGFLHVIMALLAIAAFSAITMLLWNALLPNIFGIVSINFWQALGLLVFIRILFGGIGGGAIKHLHRHHHKNHPLREKWEKMTAEERTEFINRRRQFGFRGHLYKEHFDMNGHKETEKEND